MNSRVLSSLNIPEKLKSCFNTQHIVLYYLIIPKIGYNSGALSQESNLKAVAHFFI